MPINAGIGVGGPPTSELFQVPHLWIGARDACKFASAHTIIGSSLANGSSDVNAVLGAGVKLSTGTVFWSRGTRIPSAAPAHVIRQPQSLWQRIKHKPEEQDAALTGTSVGPSGTRFGLTSTALGQVHQVRGASGILSGWSSYRPTKIKGHAFVVQDLPLPLASHRSGASWLRIKLVSPSQSCFLNSDGSTRSGPTEQGRLTASLHTDMLVGCEYSKLAIGVCSKYNAARDAQGITCAEPLELYAKVGHNKQVLKAGWAPDRGVRIEFSRML